MYDNYTPKQTLDKYVNLFNRRVMNNPDFAKLTFHCIVGQLPSVKDMRLRFGDNEIDPRISGCAFMPLGSHGENGLDFMANMCKDIGIIYKSEVVTPDRSELVGTTVYTTGYSPEKKGQCAMNKIIRGILDPTQEEGRIVHQILALPKAETMLSLKSGQHKELVRFYEAALKTTGSAGNRINVEGEKRGKKKRPAEWVNFYPSCSLIFVSQIPKSFPKMMKECDILQSMILTYNNPTTKDKIRMAKESTGMISDIVKLKDYDYLKLTEILQGVDNHWSRRKLSKVRVNDETVAAINKIIDKIFKEIKGVSVQERALLEDYAQSMVQQVWKISWHYAILRQESVLIKEDISFAGEFLLPLWKNIVSQCRNG